MASEQQPGAALLSTLDRPAGPEDDPADPVVATIPAGPDGPPRASGSNDPIDRYVVLHELGRGGMGVVYAAYDKVLGRKVALKRLRDSSGGSEAHRRMLREARALARLSHPNVVGIYEVSEVGPRVFLAMELVHGVNLRTWLGDQPRTRAELLAVFLQAADGLAAAHAAGLVHRDFKPDNVVIGADGRVRVMDFGLARIGADDPATDPADRPCEDSSLTRAGALLGTPAYMAPEQHLGLTATAVADIYSFAVALYEAVHGERPFTRRSTRELSEQVLRGRPTHTPTPGRVPAWLHAVILRGMAVEPTDRWPTMAAFAAALRADPRIRLRRALVAVAVIVGVLALALVLPPVWHDLQVGRERERIEALAEARLQAFEALQRGGDAGADAAFAAFVAAEEHRGTRALARAWLRRGQAAWSEGQVDAGLDAMARAYAEAREPADIVAAMRAIAAVHHARWQIAELAPALAVLAEHGQGDDPESLRMRVDVALGSNDFTAALTALDAPAAPPELAPLRPLLATLAHGRPLGLQAERVVPVTHAGGPGFVLLSEHATRVTLTDAALRPRAEHTVASGVLELVTGTPAWFAPDGDATALFAWDGGTPTRLWRAPAPGNLEPRIAAWLDLGDGGSFLFGAQWKWRGFHQVRRGADGAWTAGVGHAETHAGRSDLGALMASDLDADGRPELVVGTGVWSQLDLRIFRTTAAGLELVDLRAPGRITGLAMVRGDGPPRLAALKDDRYAPFPDPPYTGDPAGVYLYTWTDGHLVDAGHLPLPQRGERAALPIAEGLLACDLDGDGRSELLAGLTGAIAASERERLPHTLVLHQRPDGGFQRAVLGLHTVACAQLDDDPADELVASSVVDTVDPGRTDLWILGVGATPVPPRRETSQAQAPGPPPSDDPLLVDRWTRANRLVASGLTATAVRLLRDTAELASDARVDQALLVQAARLQRARSELREAADLYDKAARKLALPGPAALQAAEAHVGLGEVAVADQLLRTLVADADVDEATREAAAARLTELAPLLGHVVALDFADPLAPDWTLDPLVLRRDARAGTLRVEVAGRPPELASLPLVWTGGAAALTVDFEVDHLESGASLEVILFDAEGDALIGLGVFAPHGQPRQQWISCHDPGQATTAKFAAVPTDPTTRHTVRARTMWDPARGVVTCDAEVDGVAGHFTSNAGPTAARPGPMSLAIASTGEDFPLVSADLRALTLHGVSRPATPAAPQAPDQRAAHLLVEGRPDEALAAPWAGGDADLWRFLAHDRMREPAAATAALRAHLTAHPGVQPALMRMLRVRPDRIGPPLRALLGADVHPIVTATLTNVFTAGFDQAWFHDLVRTEFPWHADLAATDPDTRLRTLLMHAVALAGSGRPGEAREFVRRALAEAEAPRTALRTNLANQWFYLARTLASVAPDEAMAALREGIRLSSSPETSRRRARAQPEFDALGADPAWLDIVGWTAHGAAAE